MTAGFLCATADLHPYECGAGCHHCERRPIQATDGTGRLVHDPATCDLCDPAYDMQPNPWRAAWEAQ